MPGGYEEDLIFMRSPNAVVAAGAIVLCATVAAAQPTPQNQLDAIAAVQAEAQARQQEAARAAQWRAWQQQQQQQANWRTAEQARHAEAMAAMRARAEAASRAAAEKSRKEAEAAAARKRDDTYVDQLRDMELQRQQLAIDAQKARVARANEYIDRELKKQDAETDVTQSVADTNRNLSAGARKEMEDRGAAAVKHESSWLDR